jgi:hypothetical protein
MVFKPASSPDDCPLRTGDDAWFALFTECQHARGVRTVLLSDPLSLNPKEMSRRKCQVLAISFASVKEFTKLNNSDL